jgi:hypothetical protein
MQKRAGHDSGKKRKEAPGWVFPAAENNKET